MYVYSNEPAFISLKKEFSKINVVDAGAARASFIVELTKYFEIDNIKSIGIDPLNHNVSNFYNKFYNVCVDDIPLNTVEKALFNIGEEDQSSSLSPLCLDNFTTNAQVEDKYYMNDVIFSKVKNIISQVDVDVYNIVDLINNDFENELIHFVKIDCEGKDMAIVNSLAPIFKRIKFISIECPNYVQRYQGEFLLNDCISYFNNYNFAVFYQTNYEFDPNNGSKMNDIIFINTKL
jgi:hypothetical protein